jgi:hypothetical protein
MVKENREKVRKILAPRESIVYDAKYHSIIFAVPVVVALIGIFMIYMPVDLYKYFPRKGQEAAYKAITTLKEVHAGLLLILGGSGLFLKAIYSSKHYLHLVTNFRVLEKVGRSNKKIKSVPLYRVGKITIESNIFQKLISVGKIVIHDNETNKDIELENISDPKSYKKALEGALIRFDEESIRARKENKYKERKDLK